MGGLLVLCPGQGSQYPGMAEHLWQYEQAKRTFQEASEVLGWDIGELCRQGTMEELTRTDRTQLAILTTSVATWRVLEEKGLAVSVAAGHSLGEYSALVITGHLSFADAVRVVDVRGRAMQACAEQRGGAMAAVIGLEAETVEEICASISDVWPANYNSPGQVVISGTTEGVQAATKACEAKGAKRVIPLPVAGAFHTPLMAGAAEALRAALDKVEFKEGKARFFSTTEIRFPAASELPEVLARQLLSPVKFSQAMTALLQEPEAPERGLEVGPGNVLTGLMKRIARDFPVSSAGDAQSLAEILAST
ncbi:MAG: ACP S-malonyltransferase [Thermoleophilia bacterium]|nr:ACP S-malonyltransferase [Thermoleophilia bacterium]